MPDMILNEFGFEFTPYNQIRLSLFYVLGLRLLIGYEEKRMQFTIETR